jgi:hypothetical protein
MRMISHRAFLNSQLSSFKVLDQSFWIELYGVNHFKFLQKQLQHIRVEFHRRTGLEACVERFSYCLISRILSAFVSGHRLLMIPLDAHVNHHIYVHILASGCPKGVDYVTDILLDCQLRGNSQNCQDFYPN